jgi:hypothetical protein
MRPCGGCISCELPTTSCRGGNDEDEGSPPMRASCEKSKSLTDIKNLFTVSLFKWIDVKN